MEDVIATYFFKMNDVTLDFDLDSTRYVFTALVYGISFTVLYVADRSKPAADERTKAQNNVFNTLCGYFFIVNFIIIPTIFFRSFDCADVFFHHGDGSMLLLSIAFLIYGILLYKSIFMLIVLKKRAIIFTRLMLVTIPFVFTFHKYMLYPFYPYIEKNFLPLGSQPDYIFTFFIVCLFAVPYLFFFTFSKRIKAAWADTALARTGDSRG